ncbi:polysaccharide biosynthesis tyrosine autokinase [Waterburya agarophytonicola K14]|uniref:non-specific protein-tyrosine kinase n=1 Tax=Waterburya agarophytonicola KI4 TaxID=2874699 RepID=A0A964BNM7_9CYAN|nr:polysaccharide biosynthesis tyrosine autokinase [Waterburya agarophytonicola]MCC0175956.1 polysaccharide biosynthesis tyrosine autokinase [Waterburya agarophytonicola KI4]
MDPNLHLEEYIDFNRYWQVIKRRWVPATATFAGILGISLIAALTSEKVFEAEAQLQIKPDNTENVLGIKGVAGESKTRVLDSKDPLETEAKILQSRPIVEKLIKELELKDKNGKTLTYKNVAKNLQVEPVIGTELLQVSYADPDPDVAVAFVDRAVEIYREDYALFSRREVEKARNFLESELPKAEDNVRQAEEELRQFKNRNRIPDIDGITTTTIDSLSGVEGQIDGVEAELKDINAQFNRLGTQLNMTWQEASAVSSLSQSISVQRVLGRLQDVKVALAQKKNFLSDSAPQIVSLKEEEADLNALLEREIASTLGSQPSNLTSKINILSLGELKQAQLAQYGELGLRKEGLEQKLASLRNTYSAYQRRSDNLPQLQQQQRELQRKVEAAQKNFNTLLSRKQEIDVLVNKDNDKVRVVANAALAEDPVNPDGKVIVAAGAMMGALFGMALAFLLDLKDNTIKNTQEVEDLFAYPLHGIVPNLSLSPEKGQLQLAGTTTANLPEQVVTDVSMLPLKEAYQNIQVNLKLLDSDTEQKLIAITSSVPQEGKSSVSANLAVARAQCGQRILLVDADMRRPTQHHIWEISNQVGLSNVLKHETQWEDGVQNVMPNLDVLTAGTIPDHPIALLDSAFMKAFIDNVARHYDQVIFDTPPIIGIADTKIIGKLVNGFLFVVRPGVADYGSASAAKKMLDSTGLKVLGVIVNGADMNREPYYYNSYYYKEQNNN